METWILPLTLIPGIGLFIMSTVNQANHLSGEINTLISAPEQHCQPELILQKIAQLDLLNKSLTCFYISASCLVLAGLLGGLLHLPNWTFKGLMGLATLNLLVPMVFLIRFSSRKVAIKREQFKGRLAPNSNGPSA